jgi:hypothetical protein
LRTLNSTPNFRFFPNDDAPLWVPIAALRVATFYIFCARVLATSAQAGIRVILEHRRESPVALRAAVENLDHLAYLLQLCELELIERERRAAERRLKAAKFPGTKTLDEFDFRK